MDSTTDTDEGITDFSGFLEGGDGKAPGADGLPKAQALSSPIRSDRGDGRVPGADSLPEAQALPSLNRVGKGGDGRVQGAYELPETQALPSSNRLEREW